MSSDAGVTSKGTLCMGSWVEPEATVDFDGSEDENISLSSANADKANHSVDLELGRKLLLVEATSLVKITEETVPPLAEDDADNVSSHRSSSVSTITEYNNESSKMTGKGISLQSGEAKHAKEKKTAYARTLRKIERRPQTAHQRPHSLVSYDAATATSQVVALTSAGRTANLIKALWSPETGVVLDSLVQLHSMIETSEARVALETDLHDNTLELSLVRRGGHLALLHTLAMHRHAAVQAMGWAALTFLCERCNIKSMLVSKGAVALVTTILKLQGISASVTTEALYFLGHLATLPKVAEQVTLHDNVLSHVVLQTLPGSANAQDIVDALFFLCKNLAARQNPKILHFMWQAGSRKMVVRVMQESLLKWDEADGHPGVCQLYEDRLEIGCAICTYWANTPFPNGGHVSVVRALIEAGALTVSAELLRLFPAGTSLRRAANRALRAMVPVAED